MSPGKDRTHIDQPRPSRTSGWKSRGPQPKDPGGTAELRMDDVRGRFVFDNGMVTMNDVSVLFRGAYGSPTGRSLSRTPAASGWA
jgi:hypothetical protein